MSAIEQNEKNHSFWCCEPFHSASVTFKKIISWTLVLFVGLV